MKKLSFTLAVLGMFSLLLFFNLPPKTINSPEELSNMNANQKILVEGSITKETYYKNYKLLSLDNEIQLKCDLSCPNYLGRNISALAVLEKYNNKDYLKILQVNLLN